MRFERYRAFGFTALAAGALALGACTSDPSEPTPELAPEQTISDRTGEHDRRSLRGPGMSGHGFALAMADELELSDEQIASIRTVMAETMTRQQELRSGMRAMVEAEADSARRDGQRRAPRAERQERGERPDSAARAQRGQRRMHADLSEEQRAAMQPLIQEMRMLREQSRERIQQILTAEQRAELQQAMETRRTEWRERMQQRREQMEQRRGDRRSSGAEQRHESNPQA